MEKIKQEKEKTTGKEKKQGTTPRLYKIFNRGKAMDQGPFPHYKFLPTKLQSTVFSNRNILRRYVDMFVANHQNFSNKNSLTDQFNLLISRKNERILAKPNIDPVR